MKAIDKLIELRKTDSSIVAIAKDIDGNIFYYKEEIPEQASKAWTNYSKFEIGYNFISEHIIFDSENWEDCIVTYKDLPISNYEVKMMSISVQDYERLVQAEKTLENIKKFLS